MDSLEFECPLCNGLFSAAVADVEVTCPHCHETVSLSVVDPSSPANVTMVAKQIATPEPLFPPGHKKFPATESTATTKTTPEPPIVIMDGDVDESIDVMVPITPPATVPDVFPFVVTDDSGAVDELTDELQSINPPATVPSELPSVVTGDGNGADESVDNIESITPEPVADVMPAVVIAKDETSESPDSTVTETAIEDLLPPGFQLEGPQADKQKTTEAAEIIDVRVDTDPATVGRGVNKRELRSRTPDEKSQFTRKKNLIVWGIGAVVIIVTMVVMLQLA
jgi:hypothetical protein